MQITYNQSELETIVTTHILDTLPGSNPEDIRNVAFNEDGSVTIVIGEEVSHGDDNPPVVETDKPVRQRRQRRTNPQEAKHRPVDTPEVEPETPTTVGGQSESSTLEAESPKAQGEPEVEPTQELKEEATAEAEAAEPEVATEKAAVEEKAQEAEVEEKPVTTKPSLFAGLKR